MDVVCLLLVHMYVYIYLCIMSHDCITLYKIINFIQVT